MRRNVLICASVIAFGRHGPKAGPITAQHRSHSSRVRTALAAHSCVWRYSENAAASVPLRDAVWALFLGLALRLPTIVRRARDCPGCRTVVATWRRTCALSAHVGGRLPVALTALHDIVRKLHLTHPVAPRRRASKSSGGAAGGGTVPANQNDFAVGVNFHPRHGKPSLHCTSSCARDLRLSEGRTAAGHGVAPPDPFSPRRSWTIVALVAGAASLREEKAATAQRRRVLLRCFVRAIANHFNKLTRCALRYLLRAIGVASPLFLLRRFLNDFNGALRSFSAGLRAFSPFSVMAHTPSITS